MDLAELKFVVDTKQLEIAATRVAELGTAVSKLNKPMQDLSKESAKNSKELSKAEEAAAKAALAQLKLEQAQTKSTEATSKSASVLERQNLILEYMAQGNSKGQASILATAKAAGALDDEMLALNNTLKTQRTLIGGDPFDKSIGLMQKLQNEYKTTNEVSNLFNKNLGLTEKQMIDLAREKERLIALYGIEGRSLDGLSAEYDQLIRKSVEINQANSTRTNSMKAQVKAQDDAAKANNYITSEMDRLNRLTESNGSITSATNNKQIKFEQALKASGKTVKEQADLLAEFNKQMLSTQKAAGNRQVDYLSRALGPQITDIGVGLATGQSPMMVLLQQGGQLRDQFALAGVAGKDMGDMLVKAAGGMVTSIKDVGLAVGQVLVKSITGVGSAIIGGIVAPFKRLSEAKEALKQLDEGVISNLRYTRLLEVSSGRALQSLISFGKVGATLAVAGLIMLAKGLYDVVKEQDALTTQLVLTGASLGLNVASATSYATALNSVGINTSSALKVMSLMAKEGGFVAEDINKVTIAAVELEKYGGVALETTVKQFAKLKEKPVEALLEIAKATGLVPIETLKLVDSLVEQGKKSEAAAISMKAYADVVVTQKDRLKGELSDFAIFMKSLSSSVSDFFEKSFKALWRKSDPIENLKTQIADFRAATALLSPGTSDEQRTKDAETLKQLEKQLGLMQSKSDMARIAEAEEARKAKLLEEFAKDNVQFASNEMKRNKELSEAIIRNDELIAAGIITKAQAEKQYQNIRDKYKTPSTAQYKVPEDFYLKQLKEDYKDATKEVDSESKKLLAQNKSSYDLGLIDTGTYLSEELRLIQEQNKQKTNLNNGYTSSFQSALGFQITAINKMAAEEKTKTHTDEDRNKIEKQRVESIKSVTEAYKLYIQGIASGTEVLADNSAEQQAKAIAILGQETKKLVEGSKEFIKTQDDIIAKRVLATELEQKTAGLYGAEAERVKAQILMEQSHIDKLSDLQQMALKAGVALSKLTLSGISQTSPEYLNAQQAVANAEKSLNEARVKSKEATEKAGFDAVAKYQDIATQRLNAYGSAFEKMFSGMGDAIIEFAKTGKLNFTGLVNSMIEDLIRFEMKKQMLGLYESMGGAKGIMGAVSSIFGIGGYSGMGNTNSNVGTSTSPFLQANGGAWDKGIQAFANGGAFTNSIVSEPTLFKFAKGTGLMGEAGPEAIMPLRRGADGSLGVAASGGSSGGNVSVQVINNSSSQATTNETVDSKGNRKIEVVIGDMQAGEISRSGSASQKSIKSTFGIQPQLIRR